MSKRLNWSLLLTRGIVGFMYRVPVEPVGQEQEQEQEEEGEPEVELKSLQDYLREKKQPSPLVETRLANDGHVDEKWKGLVPVTKQEQFFVAPKVSLQIW